MIGLLGSAVHVADLTFGRRGHPGAVKSAQAESGIGLDSRGLIYRTGVFWRHQEEPPRRRHRARDVPAAAASAWTSGSGGASSGSAGAGSSWSSQVVSKLCQWLSEHSLMVIRTSVFQASVAAMLLASTRRLRAQRRIR
jgi:hypothetical protein